MSLWIEILENNILIDKIQVDWLQKYNIRPKNIQELINFCEYQMIDIKYNIDSCDQSNIQNIKDTICNRIQKSNSINEVIYYLQNKGYNLERQYRHILNHSSVYFIDEYKNFELLKTFLSQYNHNNYTLLITI